MSIWLRRISTGVSWKRAGCEAPATCQTMSGGCPWFQAVVSARIRSFSSALVTSAEIVVKRCLEVSFAAVWNGISIEDLMDE